MSTSPAPNPLAVVNALAARRTPALPAGQAEQGAALLLATARRLVVREAEAIRLVQETLTAVLPALGQPADHGGVWMRLQRALLERCLDTLRQEAREDETPIEPLLPRFAADGRHAAPVEDWGPSNAEGRLGARLADRVRTAVAMLPPRHRAVFVLNDVEKLALDEVASVLRLGPSEVKLQLHQARQALREALTPIFGTRGEH